jgi:hypothetical protein
MMIAKTYKYFESRIAFGIGDRTHVEYHNTPEDTADGLCDVTPRILSLRRGANIHKHQNWIQKLLVLT